MKLEGRILGNRYEIIEKIGNGGMATVYKAKCLVLNRFVAVKILRDEFTTDQEFIKRFNSEAQAVACFTHPNIVSVYDVGKDGDLYYIVMELIKGKTLKEIIVEDGKLSWKWSLKVAIQIASALETAHKKNIIHRDIKPHNIIITEDGIAKVTDFGIAKAISNSTMTAFGATIGSVHYFSPEHARGGITDAKSDLYSLGVVMYEMITGRVPFDADTAVSVALKHMQEEPLEPIVLNPDIPDSVNKIIKKAMQKDPDLRYNSATEMIKDLEMAVKTPDADFVRIKTPGDNFKTQKINIVEEDNRNMGRKDVKEKRGKLKAMGEFFNKHKILRAAILIVLAIAILIGAFFGSLAILNAGKVASVQIPNLVGLTIEEAKAKLSEEKINLQIEKTEEKFDEEIEADKIIAQDPKYQANFTVKEGSKINVTVSKGPEMVIMIKTVGMEREEARKALKESGLKQVTMQEEYNDKVESGYVIEQNIIEGEEISAKTEIILKISTGIEQVDVPDLYGMTESEAKDAIGKAQLTWKSTTKASDSSKPNGVVISQSIEAKGKVDKGTEITIVINEFEEIKSASINVNVKSLLGYVAPEPIKNTDGTETLPEVPTVKLKITAGTDIIYNSTVKKDSTGASASYSGTGTVTVKVYIDDILKRTEVLNLNNTSSLTIE